MEGSNNRLRATINTSPIASTITRETRLPQVVSTDDFPCTTLDDYAAQRGGRVDFIKMDIEGAELEALEGARRMIMLKELNPDYVLTFGHHTPIFWESVFYAVNRGFSTEMRNRAASHACQSSKMKRKRLLLSWMPVYLGVQFQQFSVHISISA